MHIFKLMKRLMRRVFGGARGGGKPLMSAAQRAPVPAKPAARPRFAFKGAFGLQVMALLTKRLLGPPAGFKSGKYSNVGPVRAAGSKLARKAAEGKLAGVGRGY